MSNPGDGIKLPLIRLSLIDLIKLLYQKDLSI